MKLALTAGLLLISGSLLSLPLLTPQWLIITCVLIWCAAWGHLCFNITDRHASGNETEAGSALITILAQVAIARGAGGGIIVDHISIGGDLFAGSGIVLPALSFLWFRTPSSDIPGDATHYSDHENARWIFGNKPTNCVPLQEDHDCLPVIKKGTAPFPFFRLDALCVTGTFLY